MRQVGETLGVLDEAVERARQRHQQPPLVLPGVVQGAGQLAVRDLRPQRLATLLQPDVEGVQRGEGRHGLPQSVASVAHVLLDLTLLPAGGRVAELDLEEVVADHRGEARVDVARLAGQDLVHGGLHVVVDAALGHAAEHAEGVVVGVEQHLMGLQQVGPDVEGPAVAELEVRHLQLGALATQHGPVLAPVELEGLAGLEDQGHECAAPGGLLFLLALERPVSRERSHAVVRAVEAEFHQLGVHLLQRAPLFAVLAGLGLEPLGQLVRERIELAHALALGVRRFLVVAAQILPDGVARQARAPCNLADGQPLSQRPSPDDT